VGDGVRVGMGVDVGVCVGASVAVGDGVIVGVGGGGVGKLQANNVTKSTNATMRGPATLRA